MKNKTNTKKLTQTAIYLMSCINGYMCNESAEKDNQFLKQFGVKVLTPKFDCFNKKEYLTTEIGRALLKEFGQPGDNTSEDWFFIEKDGLQLLVAEHYGQWFVGQNVFDMETKKLKTINFA